MHNGTCELKQAVSTMRRSLDAAEAASTQEDACHQLLDGVRQMLLLVERLVQQPNGGNGHQAVDKVQTRL